MKRRSVSNSGVRIIMLVILILLWMPLSVLAMTYYVDAIHGNDLFSGTEKEWRYDACFEKFCGPFKHAPGMEEYAGWAVLQPGDAVIFKKGAEQIWNHSMIADVANVTYTTDEDYGAGDATFHLGGEPGFQGKHFGIRIKASNITVSGLTFTKGVKTFVPEPTVGCGEACYYCNEDLGKCYALLTFEESGLNDACISIAPDGISYCSGGINTDGVTDNNSLGGIEVNNCKFIDSTLAAISMRFATDTLITNNIINASNVNQKPGKGGISLSTGCKNVTISNNDISGVSGWAAIGVQSPWRTNLAEQFPITVSTTCNSNGVIHAFEYTDYDSQFPENITIERNKIHDSWTIGIMGTGSHNIIQYNELYNINKGQSPAYVPPVMDGNTVITNGKSGYGGYVLGTAFTYDSDIRYNMVHDCYAWPQDNYGYPPGAFGTFAPPEHEGHAIYLEWFSWGNRYYGNLVYNNQTMGLHTIIGGDNAIYNNTFYNNGTSLWEDTNIDIVLNPGDSFYNNIIVTKNKTALKIRGEYERSIFLPLWMQTPLVDDNNKDLSFFNNIFFDESNQGGTSKYIAVTKDTYAYPEDVSEHTINEFETYALGKPETYSAVSGNQWLNPNFINPSDTSSICDLRLQDDSLALGEGYYDPDYMTNLQLLDPIQFVTFNTLNSKTVVGDDMPVGAFAYKDNPSVAPKLYESGSELSQQSGSPSIIAGDKSILINYGEDESCSNYDYTFEYRSSPSSSEDPWFSLPVTRYLSWVYVETPGTSMTNGTYECKASVKDCSGYTTTTERYYVTPVISVVMPTLKQQNNTLIPLSSDRDNPTVIVNGDPKISWGYNPYYTDSFGPFALKYVYTDRSTQVVKEKTLNPEENSWPAFYPLWGWIINPAAEIGAGSYVLRISTQEVEGNTVIKETLSGKYYINIQ